MASIKTEKAVVRIDENTLRALNRAVERAREEIEFVSDPIPEIEMDMETYRKEQKKRGIIRVSSCYSDVAFEIALEVGESRCESLGFELE